MLGWSPQPNKPELRSRGGFREMIREMGMEMTRRQAALLLAEAMVGVPLAAGLPCFRYRNCMGGSRLAICTRRPAGRACLYRALV